MKSIGKFLYNLAVIFLTLWMVYASMLKLIDFPGMEESFMVWKYSKTFMYVIGGIEMLISILIFFPYTRRFGLAGLMMLMSGAMYTHFSNYEYDQLQVAFLTFLTAIGLFAYDLFVLSKKNF